MIVVFNLMLSVFVAFCKDLIYKFIIRFLHYIKLKTRKKIINFLKQRFFNH